MKKTSIQKFTQLLYSSLGRGLLTFFVFGLAMATYAVVFPTVEPNPASGVVGLYVGPTQSSYDGNDATGYTAADAFCNADYSGSHVCRLEEMINTYTHNATAMGASTDIVWVNAPGIDSVDNLANDCRGWTQNDAPWFGKVWNFNRLIAGVQQCNTVLPYACCE